MNDYIRTPPFLSYSLCARKTRPPTIPRYPRGARKTHPLIQSKGVKVPRQNGIFKLELVRTIGSTAGPKMLTHTLYKVVG